MQRILAQAASRPCSRCGDLSWWQGSDQKFETCSEVCGRNWGIILPESAYAKKEKKIFFPFSGTFEIFHTKMGEENV